MEWQIIVALVIAIPIVLIPVLFVWYLNIGGVYTAIKEARARRVVQKKQVRELAGVEQQVTIGAVKKQGK